MILLCIFCCVVLVRGDYLWELDDKVNTNGDSERIYNPEEKDMSSVDKRYLNYPIENNVMEKDTYYEYSNTKLAWWIKRGENHEPSGCDDTLELSDFGAYYLNENAQEKVIYLTFDCGYENGYTDEILSILEKEDVPACFFVTQTYIRDNVELTQKMKEQGHQVGNHTVTHPSMPSKSYEENRR